MGGGTRVGGECRRVGCMWVPRGARSVALMWVLCGATGWRDTDITKFGERADWVPSHGQNGWWEKRGNEPSTPIAKKGGEGAQMEFEK